MEDKKNERIAVMARGLLLDLLNLENDAAFAFNVLAHARIALLLAVIPDIPKSKRKEYLVYCEESLLKEARSTIENVRDALKNEKYK